MFDPCAHHRAVFGLLITHGHLSRRVRKDIAKDLIRQCRECRRSA